MAINDPSACSDASPITSIPFIISPVLMPSNVVEEFIANVNVCADCIEVIVNELPEVPLRFRAFWFAEFHQQAGHTIVTRCKLLQRRQLLNIVV